MNTLRSKNNEICRYANMMDGLYYDVAKKMGVNISKLTLFYALQMYGSVSQKQLCEEWLIPKTTVNTVVKKSLEDGDIEFKKVDGSKEKLIVLTEAGNINATNLLKDLYRAENRALQLTIDKYSDEFIEVLAFYTKQLDEEFKAIDKKE